MARAESRRLPLETEPEGAQSFVQRMRVNRTYRALKIAGEGPVMISAETAETAIVPAGELLPDLHLQQDARA